MVTAHDPDDLDSPRVVRHLPRFAAAPPPDPAHGWRPWQELLSDSHGEPAEQLNVTPHGGFGTVCCSLVALPAEGAPIWLFAAGPPDATPFRLVCPTTDA
jgi:hypothetical protein